MASVREERQLLMRHIVRDHQVRTQNDMVAALRERGCDVTQATVSRDIAGLDLRKDENGFYVLAEDLRLRQSAASAVRETRRAGNQVVVLTDPGLASSVAAALDAAELEGVLGSLAGDDTVLVITADEESGAAFQATMDEMVG